MGLLDNLYLRFTNRKVGNLLERAVEENVVNLLPAVLEESGTHIEQVLMEEPAGQIFSKKLYANKRSAVSELKKSLTELRRFNRISSSNTTIMRSPYRYDRIDVFYAKEAYFARAVTRQIETLLRNGYRFVSDNKKYLEIVNRKMNLIQMQSGKNLDQILSRMLMDLLKYSMFILEKQRGREADIKGSDNRKEKLKGLRLIRPHNLMFYLNKEGRIVSVKEMGSYFPLANQDTEIKSIDLAIGQMYDPGYDIFPIPNCYQMMDDILTLRSIEETIELMSFQFGSPLLHAKVGERDAKEPGPQEIREVHNNLVDMAPNGMITTAYWVNIDVLNIQKGVANLVPYLEYFKNRVLIGSGTSSVSVGEGDTANRATSESIDDALADRCRYLAGVISGVFNNNIIPDILLEEGVPKEELFDKQGQLQVKLEFNETSLEKQIALINNVINLYQANLLTLPEARKRLKEVPLAENEEKLLYVYKIQIPLALAGKADPGGESGSSSAGSKAKAANQPQNQHGTKAGPGSRKN